MPTCRDVIGRALRAIKAIEPGDMAHIDQLTDALGACQDLVLELHEARGPLRDIDVPGEYATCPPFSVPGGFVAAENMRVRVQAGATITVTLPNSVAIQPGVDPFDYGFIASPAWYVQGSTGTADGVFWRQPRDGARIEIVGATSELFFYRADINQWISAYDLRLDDELPLNARYRGPFATWLGERVSEDLSLGEPTPGFTRRAANARALLLTRPGTRGAPARATYF